MNDVVARPSNPFGDAMSGGRAMAPNAVANTDQQRAVAEVQAAMMIARMNPRDPIAAMDRILNACTRPTLANAAVYTYSRGGTDITGPSIRLAEAMAQSWGNMQFGIRELEQRGGESTVQAFAWDVETNTRREVTFQVPHERHTKRGVTKLTDPRDVYELVANQGARRLRACILAVIPGDVTEAAVQQCTLTTEASADTSEEGVTKMLRVFSKLGVSKEQIEKFIQRRTEAIRPAQVVRLVQIATSLREGMSIVADWFEVVAAGPSSSGIDAVKAATTAKAADSKPVGKTLAQYKAEIDNATGAEAAALVLDESRDALDEGDRTELGDHYSAKWERA